MSMVPRNRIRSEHEEQKVLFQWSKLIPELACMFAIPNGGLRKLGVAGKMKAEGVKAGVPDIFLPVARGTFHGLFIELKSVTGRATPEQMEWINELRRNGYAAVVCRGSIDAMKTIETYLGIKG